MKKEFVSYELAVKLKELGFNEPCLFLYNSTDDDPKPFLANPADAMDWNTLYVHRTNKHLMSAPTYSQAFRWFREKYHIIGEVKFKGGKTTKTAWYDYVIYSEIDWNDENPSKQWKKHEEAELACLTKLIEIVENKVS